jgi:hypothetical protein
MDSSNLLAFVVAVLSIHQSSYAEWTHFGSAKNAKYDYFLRPNLIKTEENLRTTWVMFNYKNKNDNVRSSIALNEYDCNLKKVRTNYLIQYDGEMATVNVLITSAPPKENDYWRSTEKRSVTSAIMDLVCEYDGKMPILRS